MFLKVYRFMFFSRKWLQHACLGHENGAPTVASGTPWASIMAPKIENRSQKCHPGIDAEKVLKITVKWHGNCGQMHGKIDKCRQKCDPEIDTEKVSNIDAKIEGKWNQK